jgi:hypothetical protein
VKFSTKVTISRRKKLLTCPRFMQPVCSKYLQFNRLIRFTSKKADKFIARSLKTLDPTETIISTEGRELSRTGFSDKCVQSLIKVSAVFWI